MWHAEDEPLLAMLSAYVDDVLFLLIHGVTIRCWSSCRRCFLWAKKKGKILSTVNFKYQQDSMRTVR